MQRSSMNETFSTEYNVCSKSIKTDAVFIKIKMNKE